jgi:hypothetical protein
LGAGIWDLGFRAWVLDFGTWNLGFGPSFMPRNTTKQKRLPKGAVFVTF